MWTITQPTKGMRIENGKDYGYEKIARERLGFEESSTAADHAQFGIKASGIGNVWQLLRRCDMSETLKVHMLKTSKMATRRVPGRRLDLVFSFF